MTCGNTSGKRALRERASAVAAGTPDWTRRVTQVGPWNESTTGQFNDKEWGAGNSGPGDRPIGPFSVNNSAGDKASWCVHLHLLPYVDQTGGQFGLDGLGIRSV